MFAVIYLAFGALIGTVVASPVNGTVLIFFVWITDVMFGPVFGSPTRPAGRVFPTHYLSMWMTDLPSHHAGRIGDFGWALAWTLGAAALALAVLTSVSRAASTPRRARPGSARDQLWAAIRAGLTDWGRNRVLWVLLIAVPAVFIVIATALAPGQHRRPHPDRERPPGDQDCQPGLRRGHSPRLDGPDRHRLTGHPGGNVHDPGLSRSRPAPDPGFRTAGHPAGRPADHGRPQPCSPPGCPWASPPLSPASASGAATSPPACSSRSPTA